MNYLFIPFDFRFICHIFILPFTSVAHVTQCFYNFRLFFCQFVCTIIYVFDSIQKHLLFCINSRWQGLSDKVDLKEKRIVYLDFLSMFCCVFTIIEHAIFFSLAKIAQLPYASISQVDSQHNVAWAKSDFLYICFISFFLSFSLLLLYTNISPVAHCMLTF